MSNFEKEIVEQEVLPKFFKKIVLEEGQSIKDDLDLIEFSKKTVPVGKTAKVQVIISVLGLEDK